MTAMKNKTTHKAMTEMIIYVRYMTTMLDRYTTTFQKEERCYHHNIYH